jgi:hypothetical protein
MVKKTFTNPAGNGTRKRDYIPLIFQGAVKQTGKILGSELFMQSGFNTKSFLCIS